jgi:hypothetical protein
MADRPTRTGLSQDAADESADDPRVVSAVKEYLALLESGGGSRDEFLSRHADIADVLAEYLDGLEIVHGAAAEVRRRSQLGTRRSDATLDDCG